MGKSIAKKVRDTAIILFSISLGLTNKEVSAADSYNLETGVLNIPLVKVSDLFYQNVNVRIKKVVREDSSVSQKGFDIYDVEKQELRIPYVQVGEKVYKNIIIEIASVIGFEREISSLDSLNFSAEENPAKILTIVNNSSDLWSQGPFSHYTDLNGDKSEDMILVNRKSYDIRIFLNNGAGTFSEIDISGDAMKSCSEPTYAIQDFTGDFKVDIIMFCRGSRGNPEQSQFTGNKPVYLVNTGAGGFKFEHSLSINYKSVENNRGAFSLGYQQNDMIVSAKNTSVADIDNDGDFDVWVESKGGFNISSHFLINNGDGNFKIESYEKRIDRTHYEGDGTVVCHRYLSSEFLDINMDGYQDLVLGQLRSFGNNCQKLSASKYFINDRTGKFVFAGALPSPNYSGGYTALLDIGVGDFDNDKHEDLILLHTRYGSETSDTKYQSFYIQVLSRKSSPVFYDISDSLFTEFDKFSAITNSNLPYGLRLLDYNKDNFLDVSIYGYGKILDTSPLLFLFDSSLSKFKPVDFSNMVRKDMYFGSAMKPIINHTAKENGFMFIRQSGGNTSMEYLPLSVYESKIK